MQHQITEQSEILVLVLETTRSGMWEWNPQSGVVLTGPGWHQLLRYSSAEPIFWSLLIHPDDFSAVITRLAHYVEGKTASYISEHRLLNGAGDWL